MTGIQAAAHAIAASEASLARGEPLAAYNAAQAGLEHWPGDARLRQLQALALARSGDLERANALLHQLAAEGHDDAETLGMLARTHKDLGLQAGAGSTSARHLEQAFTLYRHGAENAASRGDTKGALYAGINAAALALVRGDAQTAHGLAHRVRQWSETDPSRDADYWRE